MSDHWITLYSSTNGTSYRLLCDCAIGADHNGDGDLYGAATPGFVRAAETAKIRFTAIVDQLEALAREAESAGDRWKAAEAAGFVVIVRSPAPPVLVGRSDDQAALATARHMAAWDPRSVLDWLELVREAIL